MIESFAAPDNQDTWQVGQIIYDRLEVKESLGEGGMGRVYRVCRRGMPMDIAVKRPLPTIFVKAGGKEQFMREAETWIKLEVHPHVVGCYLVRMIASIPCIFVEYMAGGSLADLIEHEQRPLYQGEPTQVVASLLALAIQMAQGLESAHTQGLVHQDVKPANVLLNSEGIAKITDFGLAQARFLAGEVTRSSRAGMSGAVPGVGMMTMAYASPEQRAGKPLTHHTDMWSWAVSVLDLFMGVTDRGYGPAAGEALEIYLREGRTDPMLPPIPSGVVTLLRQCFQRDPVARPTSMHEVAAVLQEIYAEVKGTPYPHLVPRFKVSPAIPLCNRADSLRELDKLDEALATCEQALLLDPQDASTWRVKGTILHDLRRYGEALVAHEQALLFDSQNAITWTDKGGTLYHLKRYEEALAACEQAIHLDSQNAGAWREKGNALNALQRYEEALAAYEQALLSDPQDADIWTNKGVIFCKLKRYEEALVAYEQAHLFDPQNVLTWKNKGHTLCDLQRYEEALASYEQVIHLDSQDANVWGSKGAMLCHLQRYEEALVACEQAIHLDSQNALAWKNKGATLDLLQRYEEALTAHDQALLLNPQDASIWTNRGATLYHLKRYGEALVVFEQAIHLNPTSALACTNVGRVLYKLGRLKRIVGRLWAGLPPESNAWFGNAAALRAIGRVAKTEQIEAQARVGR